MSFQAIDGIGSIALAAAGVGYILTGRPIFLKLVVLGAVMRSLDEAAFMLTGRSLGGPNTQ